VTVVCLLWVIPTAGTVISSFRTSDAANSSGWWRALTTPLDTGQYTLLNYRFAWTGGMASAYLNSLAVTLPAVALPIMARLPRSIVDSAAVDGASHWQVFWRLVVPLSIPALASVAVFQFLLVWNDLIVALVFIGEGDHAPVTIALAGAVGGVGGQAPQFASGAALIAVAAPVVAFVALQRYFVRGLTTGALGG
jgi:ABC-type glycerol-3-phosphate transport system permease component